MYNKTLKLWRFQLTQNGSDDRWDKNTNKWKLEEIFNVLRIVINPEFKPLSTVQ